MRLQARSLNLAVAVAVAAYERDDNGIVNNLPIKGYVHQCDRFACSKSCMRGRLYRTEGQRQNVTVSFCVLYLCGLVSSQEIIAMWSTTGTNARAFAVVALTIMWPSARDIPTLCRNYPDPTRSGRQSGIAAGAAAAFGLTCL